MLIERSIMKGVETYTVRGAHSQIDVFRPSHDVTGHKEFRLGYAGNCTTPVIGGQHCPAKEILVSASFCRVFEITTFTKFRLLNRLRQTKLGLLDAFHPVEKGSGGHEELGPYLAVRSADIAHALLLDRFIERSEIDHFHADGARRAI